MWGQTHDLLKGLFLAAEHRGHDATGYVAHAVPLDNPLKMETVVAKAPVRATDFVASNSGFRALAHRRCTAFVGHVRAATHGDPLAAGNVNNHPFVSDDGNLYLVHNGVVSNYEEVADKYALDLTSSCDSEVLLRLVEASPNPSQGLNECLREVKGSMAVAVYDRHRDWVWLARNRGRPLWLARLEKDRRWFFASTDAILIEAFRKVLGPSTLKRLDYLAPLPEDTPVVIAADGRVIAADTR
jgi:glucosamine--fructose-6-phosphate aminotransferase (isomerizing)